MRIFLGTALAALMLVINPALAETINTHTGTVKGITHNDISAFLGIPYAAPPVGENRWRAPQPPASWKGTRNATQFGSDCAQAPFPAGSIPGLQTEPDEDCLFVNVWKPAGAKQGDALPVLVWIHGGGFVYGGSSQSVYSGENFARDGLVFVSLNYRLGRFGFFAHPALADEGVGTNFAVLDQIAALRWVRDNIASFGGDPAQVTVFGESAGGMSVHMLLQTPLALGLFQGAIIESGAGRNESIPYKDIPSAAASGLQFSPAETAEALRAIPARDVVGNLSMATMGQPGYSGPIIDGRTILGGALDAAKVGLYARVPLIIGANSADGFPIGTDKDNIFSTFGKHESMARELYDPDGDTGGLEVATKVSADMIFIEPARAITRTLAAKDYNVWLYRFAHVGVQSGIAMGGAPHASEIPYVFDLPERRLQKLESEQDRAVASLMHQYWVNFAKTGNPNGDGLPDWPRGSANTTTVQLIGTDETKHVEDPRTATLDFRESLFNH